MAKSFFSSIIFEIKEGELVHQGGAIRGDHLPKEESPRLISFGETEILLRLVDGDEPKLTVPEGYAAAKMIQSDSALVSEKRVNGRFVEVQIYDRD